MTSRRARSARSSRSSSSRFSNAVHDISCDSCRFSGHVRDAVKYCKDCDGNLCSACVKSHVVSMKTKRHVLTEVERARGVQTARIQDKCKEHGAILVNYCVSHDSLCCHVCVVNYHRECDSVLSLKRAASGYRGSREVRTVEARLKQLQAQYVIMLKDKRNVLKSIGGEDKKFLIAVAAYRRTINSILDKIETAVIKKKTKFLEMRQDEFKDYVKSCQMAIGNLDGANLEMGSALKGSEERVFVTTKKLRHIATKYENQLRELRKTPEKVAFHFEPDLSIEKFLKNVGELGKVRIELSLQEKQALVKNADDVYEEKKRSHTQEINVKLKSDENKCYITGAVFLPNDMLVIADDSNKKVKVLSTLLKHVCYADMTSSPRDLTAISASEIAVTLPDERSIAILKTQDAEINIKSTINVLFECYGITCYERELFVTSGWSEEKVIHVMNIDGQVIRKIKLRQGILKCPLYITVDQRRNTLLISDYENGIVCLDINGSLLNRYNNVSTTGYMGVATSSLSEVYICTLQPNAILKIQNDPMNHASKHTEFERFISLPCSGSQRPRAICYSSLSNRVIISFVGQNVDKLFVYKTV